jgi:hypothetical protein
MEKNKLRLLAVLFLFSFSFSCIYAENENGSSNDEEANIEKQADEKSSPNTTPEQSSSALSASDSEEDPSSTEQNENESGPAELTTTSTPLWLYIAAGFLLLVLASLIVLGFIYLQKFTTKKTSTLEKKIDESIKNIEQKYDERYEAIMKKFRCSPNAEDMRDTIAAFENDISIMKDKISILDEIENKVDILYSGKKITESLTSGKLDVIEAFNQWAANPVGPLPEAFYYIEGEMNIRTKHELKEISVSSKWIINRKGTRKYLFPSPNSFNQMTNILELYKMDLTKLKGKGQNKIRIITPCEMTKDGFVEFAGELELL